MYALQIKKLSYISSKKKKKKNRNVYIDIASEGQPLRKYFAGKFEENKQVEYEGIIHYCHSPVTVHMSYGPTLYQTHLGVHTLFEFLQPENSNFLPWEKELTFGKKSSLLFHVSILIRKVTCNFSFELLEITCLNQSSVSFLNDRLAAKVQFNFSPHAVHDGSISNHELGRFKSQESSNVHNNLTFTTMSNFIITFVLKGLTSDQTLGMLKFYPTEEVQHNPTKMSSFQSFIDSNSNINNNNSNNVGDLQDDNYQSVFLQSAGRRGLNTLAHQRFQRVLDQSIDPLKPDNNSLNNTSMSDSYNGTLIVLKDQFDNYEDGEILFLDNPNSSSTTVSSPIISHRVTRRVTLSSIDTNAVYEIVFIVKKENFVDRDEKSVSPKTWDFINNRENYLNNMQGFLSGGLDSLSNLKRIDNSNFPHTTFNNNVEFLIDGKETFRRYYEKIMEAKHSVSILAWELSLDFGLVPVEGILPTFDTPLPSKWVTLEDVLLHKAKKGVKIRIIVWRHSMMTKLNRFMYMGLVEQEVKNFQRRARKSQVSFKILHTDRNMPSLSSPFANPERWSALDIVVIIAGNPRGLISCHHEKLVLIDPECPSHSFAFIGGFDIARGRYDHSDHQIPDPLSSDISQFSLLWHDTQILISGPATQQLRLHFLQRWNHCFSRDNTNTRDLFVDLDRAITNCKLHQNARPSAAIKSYSQSHIRLFRNWKGTFDLRLFDDFCEILLSAKSYIYLEHQYPFQNGAITYYICESLRKNPNLYLIIITPVKTDLPTGLLGDIFDWSQDHIIDHLNLIYNAAPDRVGIFGLVTQEKTSKNLKPIYVHSKLAIIDDVIMINGSTNMDNISFFYCSELSAAIYNPELATDTKVRLCKEHLGDHWTPSMRTNFVDIFKTFCKLATDNLENIKEENSADLAGRPVWMAPTENYDRLMKIVYYPNKLTKFLYKLGVNTGELNHRISSLTAPLRSNL